MKIHTYLAGLGLAALVCATAGGAPAQEQSRDLADEVAVIDIARTAFCYAGSTEDPSTGETVDLYTLCTDDLDVA